MTTYSITASTDSSMPALPKPESVAQRDELIQKYLSHALDYMTENPDDQMKGPVAKMYAEWIIETFNAA